MTQLSFYKIADLDGFSGLSSPIWVFDLAKKQIWWANTKALNFWKAASIDDLREREYSSDSAAVSDRLNVILETLPETGSFQDAWTLYPNDVPERVLLSFQRATIEGNRAGLLVEVVQKFDDSQDETTTRISEATQATSSMIAMISLEGRVLAQNPAALKCYGPPLALTSDQLDINARIPNPDDAELILTCGLNNKVVRLKTQVETRDGPRTHYISTKRGRDPKTGNPIVVLSEEDISEISGLYSEEVKRSAKLEEIVEDRIDRLRISQERIKRTLELASIWDWNIETNTLFFSPSFVDLLGYEKEELYNKMRIEGFKSIINPDDYVGYPAVLEDILANPDRPLSLEMRFITKSGEHLWIQIEGKCFCDETGRPVRTTGLLTNNTHKKILEAKLVASQKLEAIGQLTGGIAHDFNNLLTVIQGNVQLLQEIGQADDELTSEIVGAVQRGADLTRHLLAFARKQSLYPAPLDITTLLTRMRRTLLRILNEAIEVSFESPDDIWDVFADESQTEAALLNIALNARDAMPKGGTLKITVQNMLVEPDNIPKSTNLVPGQYVRISITDNGTGMAPGTVAKAFEPFFTTKSVGKGSGLGLSMVHGFSRQSKGDTRIKSEMGLGTTIALYLPRTKVPRTAVAPPKVTQTKIGRGERVHILEDNDHVSSTVTKLISSLGYTVTSSTTVTEALEVAQSQPEIAIFLVDVIWTCHGYVPASFEQCLL